MGEVYRAVDARLDRPVALKFLTGALSADPMMRERFLREARLAAALSHPAICTIYEVGETKPGEGALLGPDRPLPPGTPYLAMEFLSGRTLDSELRRLGPFGADRLTAIALPVAEALAAAHARRIVHRDLKPGNVMLLPDGRVKLLDFGLAKPLPAEFAPAAGAEAATVASEPTDLTSQGRILGTVSYMSPEQASGGAMDARSDVFSFGVMIYELAAGRRPFEGSSPVSTLARILEVEPAPLSAIRPDLPPALTRVVRRCLRKLPEERYNDTRDLVAELRELRQELSDASRRWEESGSGVLAAPGAAPSPSHPGAATPSSSHPGAATPGPSHPGASSPGPSQPGAPASDPSGACACPSPPPAATPWPPRTPSASTPAWSVPPASPSAPSWPPTAGARPGSGEGPAPGPSGSFAASGTGAAPAGWGLPAFQRLTYARGTIEAARFAPGGPAVIYSARWRGGAPEILTVRQESPESRPAGLGAARLLAVSRAEELAILRSPSQLMGMDYGRLARAPLGGGGVRELLDGVQDAEFTPDGRQLAVIRRDAFRWRVELPIGTAVYSSNRPLRALRMAPDGAALALLEIGDGRQEWQVRLIDRTGGDRLVPNCPERLTGLAWDPGGRGLLLSSLALGGHTALWALSLEGERGLLWRGPGLLRLHDAAPDGRMLLAREQMEQLVLARPPGSDLDVELSWLDGSFLTDLSSDGQAALLLEGGIGGGPDGTVYVRPTAGGPAVRLAEGMSSSISGDGAWVLLVSAEDRTRLELVPTGAGMPRTCVVQGLGPLSMGWLFPDLQRAFVMANAVDAEGMAVAIVSLETGEVLRRFPENTAIWSGQDPVSPDGRHVALIVHEASGPVNVVFPTEGGEPFRVPGLGPAEIVSGWSGDGALYVYNREGLPCVVERVEVAGGERSVCCRLMPEDAAGVRGVRAVRMARGGQGYAYDFSRTLSELYVLTWGEEA